MGGFILVNVCILMVATRTSHGLQIILGETVNDVNSRNVTIGYENTDTEPRTLHDTSKCRIVSSGYIYVDFNFNSDFMTLRMAFEQILDQSEFSQEVAQFGDRISIKVTDSLTLISSHGLNLRKKSHLMIGIKTQNANDTLGISCDSSSDRSVQSDSDVSANFCSFELTVTLACVALAFLFILLGVSVALCCVMPRKHRKQVADLRKSVLLLESKQGGAPNRRVDPFRPDTVIYDDADIRMCDSYYQGSPSDNVGYRNDSSPAAQTPGMYANTSHFI